MAQVDAMPLYKVYSRHVIYKSKVKYVQMKGLFVGIDIVFIYYSAVGRRFISRLQVHAD